MTTNTPLKIGLIGIGRMGHAIATRLLNTNHDLLIHNRTPGRTTQLEQAGAHATPTIATACANRDVVITMLANDEALTQVTLNPNGIRDSLPPNAIHMPMGTHGIDTIRTLTHAHTQANQTLITAPVLGRPTAAATGTLSIIIAGPPNPITTLQPLLQTLAHRTFHAGPHPETATAIKLANNLTLGCAIQVIGEAFSLARKYNVNPNTLHEVLTDGLFNSPAYNTYSKIISEQTYNQVGITAELGLKDANLALAAANLAHLPLPSVNTWRDHLLTAIAHGHGQLDWAIVAHEQAQAAGLD